MTSDNSYQSPNAESTAKPDELQRSGKSWRDYSPQYNAAFKTALLIQTVLAVLTALVLDYGQTHRAFWLAFLCQWAMVWIILFQRPMRPTPFDLSIVRYGIVLLLLLVAGVGPWFLWLLGVQT